MTEKANIPPELQSVLDTVSDTCTLSAFETAGMGWIAMVEISGGRVFKLVSDRFYIDVYDLTRGQEEHLFPPEDQRLSITPVQVGELINGATAD